MTLCKCGCGQEVREGKEWISGHNSKINHPNKGKHWSIDIKNKMSKGRKGKCCGDLNPAKKLDVRKKISEKMKGDNNPSKRPEVRKILSKSHIGNIPWNKGKTEVYSLETLERMSGKNNHGWKGGISKLPYCEKWTQKLRLQIRNRDNKTCQKCGKIENGRRHSVHHVHYDKENCYPDLITLCTSCNGKVNTNRDYWEEYFMKILKERNLLNYFKNLEGEE